MSQRTDVRDTGREVDGYPLGGRQGTGHPRGWELSRDGGGRLVAMPPRGTVGTNWNDVVDDDADGG